MFGKKLVLIAATAALALGSITAKEASSVHVRVHSKQSCPAGQSPMSVEGVPGVFCVSGQACVANISNGSCPGPQNGLPNGAVCGVVKTGVYGCKPAPATPAPPAPTTCTGPNKSPMSVEGVPGVFCVEGQACVANISNGACPGPQAGLPNGAVCGIVRTGVYGCKPKTAKHHHKKQGKCTGPNESPMSVEGVEGVFCVTGQACVANISNGACPGPQAGLPNGAECGKVKSGVFGCKPKAAGSAPAAPAAPKVTTNTTVVKNTTTTTTVTVANKTVSLVISVDEDDSSDDSAVAVVDLSVDDDDSTDSDDLVAADDDDSTDSDDLVAADDDDSTDSDDRRF